MEKIAPFDSNALKWTSWYKTMRTRIGQTHYRIMLAPNPPALEHEKINSEFNYMLQEVVQDRIADYIVDGVPGDDRYAAWQALKLAYTDEDNIREALNTTGEELDLLFCDDGDDIYNYINRFTLLTKRLEELGEPYTNGTKRHKFLTHIWDLEYLQTKEALTVHKQAGNLTFKAAVCSIQSRANQLARKSKDTLAQGQGKVL